MPRSKSLDGSSSSLSSSKTVSLPSNYFQTENNASKKSDESSEGETVKLSKNKKSNLLKNEAKVSSLRKEPLKSKVNMSIETDRSIVGEEDSLHKDRKRWKRPPVDGQASSSTGQLPILPIYQIEESTSEEDIVKGIYLSKRNEPPAFTCSTELYPSRKDYTNERPMEGGSDQSLPAMSDQSDSRQIPSPSSVSSATSSRPLEWDSGADVGYYHQKGTTAPDGKDLSTIERMLASVLTRSDPEGTSNFISTVNPIGLPTAESTPVSSSSSGITSSKSLISVKSHSSKKSRPHPLFPEVIINQKGSLSDTSAEFKLPQKSAREYLKSTAAKKLSSSLENLSKAMLKGHQSATFPRSQSQTNLDFELSYSSHLQRHLNPPQSVSSSSVATVVTGSTPKASKLVQTSHQENNVETQSLICGSDIRKIIELKKSDRNESSTLESGQMSSEDRVNSFEYLPGHMYENAKQKDELNGWENTTGSCLKSDIERGVHLLEEFLQGSNANNTLLKKKLLQRVVQKLIRADYPEDSVQGINGNDLQRCSTRRSQNRDHITGESSSENVSVTQKPLRSISTTLSGQSSSTLPSITESTNTSDLNSIAPDENKSHPGATYVKVKERHKKNNPEAASETKSSWKAPVTETEKIYEYRKKALKNGIKNEEELLQYVKLEREKQLHWIVKEIDHLSDLKTLLEKHEQLKKNLNRLKKSKAKTEPGNVDTRPTGNIKTDWFRKKKYSYSVPNMPTTAKISSKITQDSESNWDSHHYDTEAKNKRTVSTETRKEDLQSGRTKSAVYTIIFDPQQKNEYKSFEQTNKNCMIADRQILAKESRILVREALKQPSLQDVLVAKRPDVVSRAEIRRKTLAELTAVRQMREEKRHIVLAAALSSEPRLDLPPPVSLVKRIVSQREMRQQTEKKYRRTFEVQKKKSDQKLKDTLRTNRLMAEVFTKRLQLLTLKGHTNLSNSTDVISTA